MKQKIFENVAVNGIHKKFSICFAKVKKANKDATIKMKIKTVFENRFPQRVSEVSAFDMK